MAVLDRRTGQELPESEFGGGALEFLYGNVTKFHIAVAICEDTDEYTD